MPNSATTSANNATSTGLAPNVAGALAYILCPLTGIAFLVLWIMLMLRAFQGREWAVPVAGKYAQQYAAGASVTV